MLGWGVNNLLEHDERLDFYKCRMHFLAVPENSLDNPINPRTLKPPYHGAYYSSQITSYYFLSDQFSSKPDRFSFKSDRFW